MSREKQIKEMAETMQQHRPNLDFFHSDAIKLSEALYNAGYRKQSEGEWIQHPHFDFEGCYSGSNYECSNCYYDDCYKEEPYCPKCGAKMKGGAE